MEIFCLAVGVLFSRRVSPSTFPAIYEYHKISGIIVLDCHQFSVFKGNTVNAIS